MGIERHAREKDLVLRLCRRRDSAEAIIGIIRRPDLDWRFIAETADTHKIGARLFSRIMELPLDPSLKRRLTPLALERIGSSVRVNCAMRDEMAHVFSLLSKHGIDGILMKGLSIDPSMNRYCGDIDILIREPDLVGAIEAVLEDPEYQYEEPVLRKGAGACERLRCLSACARLKIERASRWRHAFHLYNEKRGILVELHINTFSRNYRRLDRAENIDGYLDGRDRLWGSCSKAPGLECRVLSPEHSLLLMCMHAAVKRSPARERLGLSLLMDIDALCSAAVDWTLFVNECIAVKAAPYACFALRLASAILKTEVPLPVRRRLESACSGLQLMAMRFHLRCADMFRRGSFLYRSLYWCAAPLVFTGGLAWKVSGILLLPFWAPPLSTLLAMILEGRNPVFYVARTLSTPVENTFHLLRKLLTPEAG